MFVIKKTPGVQRGLLTVGYFGRKAIGPVVKFGTF